MAGHGPKTHFKNPAVRWLDSRLPIVSMMNDQAIVFPTPKNLNYMWTFGAILTFMLVTMIVTGMAVGFVFAAVVLVISLISLPMLIDRHVGVPIAVATSLQVARENPVTVALWGAVVAVLLLLGTLPLFLGLIVVLPVLGHATWHLYRAAVPQDS